MPLNLRVLALALAVLGQAYPQTATLRQLAASATHSDLRWPNFSDYRVHVVNFYEPAGYTPAWVRNGAATAQARAIIEILLKADAKGLSAEDYDAPRWASRLARLATDDDRARFDLALTVSLMRYISDLHIGKLNPKLFHFGFDVDQKKYNLPDLLRQRLVNAPDVHTVLDQIEPPFPGYLRTQQALGVYLTLAKEDDGAPLPAAKKAVEPGDPYPGVARLTRLLRRVGDLPADAAVEPDTYQGPLVAAVKHFQARHGLAADGRLGKSTLDQLNVPLSRRVRQLQVTLERWRWVPHEFPRPPILVNIPEFRLRLMTATYHEDFAMNVVVGKAFGHQTPVFSGELKYVIFRPYWNVTPSIQRSELVPKLAKDRSYMAKNGYEAVNNRGEVVAVDAVNDETLEQLRRGRLSMRQIPGPKNALGLVKFLFPNEHNVYLHSTPSPELFSRSRRDFSHGCIRVERPEDLAAWVLKDKPEWTLDRIRKAENGDKPTQVNLAKPIPVMIVYGTAIVEENGEVHFFEDIYGHDASLEKLLAKGYPYPY